MKWIALCIFVGFVLGWITHYIFIRKPIGTLRIIDHEEMTSVFLELEKELEDVRNRKKVSLRVENSSFNENH